MSQGKYSPTLPKNTGSFTFNADGKEPAKWSNELEEAGVKYDERTMFGDYDKDGFDRYGYSAFLEDGTFVGLGSGVDRNGYTEFDYIVMDPDAYADFF